MPSARPHSEIPLAAVALATAFVQIGCKPGEDEDGLGEIGQLYLDFVDLLGEGQMFYCECAVEAGYYDSVAYCWSPAIPPPMAECIAAVLDDFPDVAEHFNCLMEGYAGFIGCAQAAGCDGDVYACYSMLDANYDCPDIPYGAARAVEMGCYGVTLPEPFACADGTQIPKTWQCDGEADCEDGSDEQNCPSFTCDDGTTIPLALQCSGEPDCPDLSDEQNCPGQFTCNDGYGIPLSYQCDGYPDCPDGSDEQGC
jgi:hypothetical protein